MSIVPPATEKRCTKCGETKPLGEFHKSKRSKDGYRSTCGECGRADARAWLAENRERNRENCARYQDANREKINAQYRANRPAIREKKAAYIAEYAIKNSERIAEKSRRWYEANRDRAVARRRLYWETHREQFAVNVSRRRARLNNAPANDLTETQWGEILAYYNQRCAYCGERSADLVQEHIAPLARGGSHTAENVVPACRPCNARKWALPLWRFLLNERSHREPHHD